MQAVSLGAAAGGIWDTKYLVQQLPELFQALTSTSLQPLYQAINPGGAPQPEVPPSSSLAVRDVFLKICSVDMLCIMFTVHAARWDHRGEGAQVAEVLSRSGVRLPHVRHAAAFTRYTGADAPSHAHEAGSAPVLHVLDPQLDSLTYVST